MGSKVYVSENFGEWVIIDYKNKKGYLHVNSLLSKT